MSTDGDDLLGLARRLAERYRRLPESRLRAPLPPFPDVAAAGHGLAEKWAIAAQGIEERAAAVEPAWRRLPVLGMFAVGDLIMVAGRDLAAAFRDVDDETTEVWTRAGRLPAGDVLAAATGAARLLDRAV